jgi:hypothetical protein
LAFDLNLAKTFNWLEFTKSCLRLSENIQAKTFHYIAIICKWKGLAWLFSSKILKTKRVIFYDISCEIVEYCCHVLAWINSGQNYHNIFTCICELLHSNGKFWPDSFQAKYLKPSA